VKNPPQETITRADGSTYTRDNHQPIERLLVVPFAEVLTTSPEDFVRNVYLADAKHDLDVGETTQAEYDERVAELTAQVTA
jgi:hypothetical protein